MGDTSTGEFVVNDVRCNHDNGLDISWLALLQMVGLTAVMSLLFVVGKRLVDNIRSRYCRLNVVVLGAGPTGLLSTLVTLRSGRASRLIVFEEHPLADLLARAQPLTLDTRSVAFIHALGVHLPGLPPSNSNSNDELTQFRSGDQQSQPFTDSMHIKSDDDSKRRSTRDLGGRRASWVGGGLKLQEAEGAWYDDKFYTSVGDLAGAILQTIVDTDDEQRVEFRFGCRFVRQSLQELETMPDRLLAIVCDGANGRGASLLGLSDEFQHISCKAYGAMADIERLNVFHTTPSISPRCASPYPNVTPRSASPSSQYTDTLQQQHQQQIYEVANCQLRRSSVTQKMTQSGITNAASRRPSTQGFYLFNTPYEADVERTGSLCHERDVVLSADDATSGSGNSKSFTRPTPDRVIHGITFDLSQHGKDFATTAAAAFDSGSAAGSAASGTLPRAFHLKIFGSLHRRYMALAVPRCESDIVRGLKACADHGIMRSVFQTCFNAYKSPEDAPITDGEVGTRLRCSARLYDIKLSQRRESVAFIEDANVFVVTEGDAARHCNFRTGLDVNLAIRGLSSLDPFIHQAACADCDETILAALRYKYQCHQAIGQEFVRSGLRAVMYPSAIRPLYNGSSSGKATAPSASETRSPSFSSSVSSSSSFSLSPPPTSLGPPARQRRLGSSCCTPPTNT